MRLLLDTHIFLWYISADPQLPVAFRDAIRDPANEVYLSVASVWEAVIKYALGKLPLPEAQRNTSRGNVRPTGSPPCLSKRRPSRTSPAFPHCTATPSTAS
jgi:PIN domain nuclease of toxin-antitoxin system